MNVLIINLTRFGDLIQTQPVISGYASLGHRVGLVCLENFASAATMLKGVDKVFPFPGAELLSQLDEDWRLAVCEATEFKEGVLESFVPDRTINLTPSVSSRLLASDLTSESGKTVGFSVDQFGFNADTSRWAAFLQLAGGNRGASPFNICDIFRRTAGLKDEGNSLELAHPDEGTLSAAKGMLDERAPSEAVGYVALQMGASEDRRRWPVASFVKTAEILWERDRIVPVLLGTKNEAELGERFRALTNCPNINCIGQTNLVELGGVLCQCKALLTNDTGTMHLAAGLGVPLCGVFLATAQPGDTGPYRAGNICLEPDLDCHPCEFGKPCPYDHECRHSVTPDVMYASFKALGGETMEVTSGARVWRTITGDEGLQELESLSGHDQTDRALWMTIQRAYYRRFLDGEPLDISLGLGGKISPEMGENISKTLTSGHDMLFLLTQQGMLLARNPREQAKTKFLASWQRFQTILSSSNYLNVLGLLWMFETQRSGDDLGALLDMTERYRTLFASLRDEFV